MNKIYSITADQLDELVKRCAHAAREETLKAAEQAAEKAAAKQKKRQFRNTGLLLANYQAFKTMVRDSVYSSKQLQAEDDAAEILQTMGIKKNAELEIESIKRSAVRTAVIMQHIDKMLELYREISARDEMQSRRYEVLRMRYLDEKALSVIEIGESLNISKESVYADLRQAKTELSALIFGAEGVIG